MTLEETITILREHNRWRRHTGDEPMPMPHSPKELGLAIDNAVELLTKLTKKPKKK